MSYVKEVWDYLTAHGMTQAGTAGLMGNLQHESGIIPNRVEILCLKRLEEAGKHYTDLTYTLAIDSGVIGRSEFINPLPGKQYGYGLAQWTSPGRKSKLYDFATAREASIGDLRMQLDFLTEELKGSYASVWQTLTTSGDVQACSDIVLTKFEQPANAESMKIARGETAYKFFLEHKEGETVKASTIINIVKGWEGYSEANGKHKSIIDIYNNYCASIGKYPRGYKVPYSAAWCDVTVSAAFIKAGAVDLIGGIECGVEEHVQIFKKKGIWIEDGTSTPKPGYIIVFNWDKATQPNDGYSDHIGLVTSLENGVITAIEGNNNDAVAYRKISEASQRRSTKMKAQIVREIAQNQKIKRKRISRTAVDHHRKQTKDFLTLHSGWGR